jgi:hypothetical protein
MILISHRGNLNGPSPEKENTIEYINYALNRGFDVEIDVRLEDNVYYLGHDIKQEKVSITFLKNNKLWCHAKNIEAFHSLLKENINCFWHQSDDYVLTSSKIIWTYPNKLLSSGSICVFPEMGINGDINQCHGICSDFIINYK